MLETVDFEVPRGSNTPAMTWELYGEDGNPLLLTDATLTLRIWADGLLITKTSGEQGLAVEAGTASLTWTPTLEESVSIPFGRVAEYQVGFKRGATTRPIISGFVIGTYSTTQD